MRCLTRPDGRAPGPCEEEGGGALEIPGLGEPVYGDGVVRRFAPSLLTLLCGVVVVGLRLEAGSVWDAVLWLVLFGALALALSPAVFPRPEAAAAARAGSQVDGWPIVYWRPGCQFCLRLRFRLGRDARRAHWVDIWRDPQGAAAVRAITGGDETVPTVVVGDEARVNPDPAWVRASITR